MRAAPHLLIVEDDAETCDLLAGFLRRHGFRVSLARNGREMRSHLKEGRIHLIILDLMLGEDDGLVLCRELRSRSRVPIIMLTALGEDVDRIVGLEMGADDYMTKPFNPRELLARIKAVMRRAGMDAANDFTTRDGVLRFGGWSLDLTERRLIDPGGSFVPLTTGEFDLLATFAERPQRVLSRDLLLDLTRGRDASPFDRSVDILVSRLRHKLARDETGRELIQTVHRVGYVFASPVSRT